MHSSAAKQREAGRVSGDDVFIYFGDGFNECIALVVWLTSLGWVSFGKPSTGPSSGWSGRLSSSYLSGRSSTNLIAGVVWPAFLQKLVFGCDSNQPMVGFM